MRWVRTWPARMPPEEDPRSYVTDRLPRVLMDHDYAPVLAGFTGDTVVVEWDIAFGPDDMQAFENHVARAPGRIHVAPYRLYPKSTSLPGPVWAHRHYHGPTSIPWIEEGDPFCDWFGFGFIYFPLTIVHRYLQTNPVNEGDSSFSRWHFDEIGETVPVHWDVRPVHLHY